MLCFTIQGQKIPYCICIAFLTYVVHYHLGTANPYCICIPFLTYFVLHHPEQQILDCICISCLTYVVRYHPGTANPILYLYPFSEVDKNVRHLAWTSQYVLCYRRQNRHKALLCNNQYFCIVDSDP
jgi:hypothetical protein